MNKTAIILGMALAGSVSSVNAEHNPFASQELNGGYMQVAMAEGKRGEAKCGADMEKSSEAKCGADMDKKAEGKCGEGKCGANK